MLDCVWYQAFKFRAVMATLTSVLFVPGTSLQFWEDSLQSILLMLDCVWQCNFSFQCKEYFLIISFLQRHGCFPTTAAVMPCIDDYYLLWLFPTATLNCIAYHCCCPFCLCIFSLPKHVVLGTAAMIHFIVVDSHLLPLNLISFLLCYCCSSSTAIEPTTSGLMLHMSWECVSPISIGLVTSH